MIKLNLQSIEKIVLYAIPVILIFFLCYQNVKLKNKVHNNEINISALTDSLEITKDKYNREVASKNILLVDYNTLKETNSYLSDELQKSKKKNLAEIHKLNITINNLNDSIKNIEGSYKEYLNNKYIYEFKDSNEYRTFITNVEIESLNKPDSVNMTLLKDEVFADLIIKKYITEDKINLQITSNNPNLHIDQIDGAVLDINEIYNLKPCPKFSFNIGPQFGIGWVKSTEPNFGNVGFYFGIGFGISYNLINF